MAFIMSRANYTGGISAEAAADLEIAEFFSVTLVSDQQGTPALPWGHCPAGTAGLRLIREDFGAEYNFYDYSLNTNFDFSVSAVTNGLLAIPAADLARPLDVYGYAEYNWWVQPLNASGGTTYHAWQLGFTAGTSPDKNLVQPFFDGRAQLKQNLAFLLRAANVGGPLKFTEYGTNVDYPNYVKPPHQPPAYAYAGFFQLDNPYNSSYRTFDILAPFENNYLYRNFAYAATNVDTSGKITTGLYSAYDYYLSGYGLILQDVPTFQFPLPTYNGQADFHPSWPPTTRNGWASIL